MDPTRARMLPPPPEDAEYVLVPTLCGIGYLACCCVLRWVTYVFILASVLVATSEHLLKLGVPASVSVAVATCVAGYYFRKCRLLRRLVEASAFEQLHTTDRLITYEGNVRAGNRFCVASFPGRYGEQWNEVIGMERSSVACVFMQEGGRGFGRHIRPKQRGRCGGWCQDCYCQQLYGQRMRFGCYWFGVWMDNIKEAEREGQTLLVFFFEDEMDRGVPEPDFKPWASFEPGVGLGSSQKGEVAWLRSRGIRFQSRDMRDWQRFEEKEMDMQQ